MLGPDHDVATDAAKLATVVRRVVESLGLRIERLRRVARLALVGGDVQRLLAVRVPQVDVTVRRGNELGKSQPLPIVGEGSRKEPAFVLVEEVTRVGRRVVAVHVEESGIAFVRSYIESVAFRCPSLELRLQLFPGRQVPLLAIRVEHIKVIQFIPALVAREQNPLVLGEVRDRQRCVGGGGCDRFSFPPFQRNDVSIEDTGPI